MIQTIDLEQKTPNGVAFRVVAGSARALPRATWLQRWHLVTDRDAELDDSNEEAAWLGWDAWVTTTRGH